MLSVTTLFFKPEILFTEQSVELLDSCLKSLQVTQNIGPFSPHSLFTITSSVFFIHSLGMCIYSCMLIHSCMFNSFLYLYTYVYIFPGKPSPPLFRTHRFKPGMVLHHSSLVRCLHYLCLLILFVYSLCIYYYLMYVFFIHYVCTYVYFLPGIRSLRFFWTHPI